MPNMRAIGNFTAIFRVSGNNAQLFLFPYVYPENRFIQNITLVYSLSFLICVFIILCVAVHCLFFYQVSRVRFRNSREGARLMAAKGNTTRQISECGFHLAS